MDLDVITHPEIVAGKRGLQSAIDIYKHLIPKVDVVDGGVRLTDELIELSKDENLIEHMVLCKTYVKNKGQTYFIPADFAKALAKMDAAIPVEYLPDHFIGYFHFADGNVINDGEENVIGAYVFIGNASEIGVYHKSGDPKEKTIAVSYINEATSRAEGAPKFFPIGRFCGPALGQKVAEIVKSGLTSDCLDVEWRRVDGKATPMPIVKEGITPTKLKERISVYRLAINAALYVSSTGADIMKLPPLKTMTHSKRKEWRDRYPVRNQGQSTLTVLNWGYAKGIKTFGVDSTMVETHMRWQPCGPKWSEVKLIWVREHERRYSKSDVKEEMNLCQ